MIETISVSCIVATRIPTIEYGEFKLYLYSNTHDTLQHMAIVYGEHIRSSSLDAIAEDDEARIIRGTVPISQLPLLQSSLHGKVHHTSAAAAASSSPILTRIHSSCFTGETLFSSRCDCADQLFDAMAIIKKESIGVIVYLLQEGRGIGLFDKLRAYNLQDLGHDTVTANELLLHPPDARSYRVASLILDDLGICSIKLLTNNPEKVESLERDGIQILERVAMIPRHWQNQQQQQQQHHVAESTGHAVSSSGGSLIIAKPTVATTTATMTRELDGYIIAKVERMKHILEIPLRLRKKKQQQHI